mmetsp:Transcript_11862/g.28365  ORF Transcript_11862/g.28365 Transcript_11862/m.28365 type:complete len:265 (+) Transcript_11862:868-1662(+)
MGHARHVLFTPTCCCQHDGVDGAGGQQGFGGGHDDWRQSVGDQRSRRAGRSSHLHAAALAPLHQRGPLRQLPLPQLCSHRAARHLQRLRHGRNPGRPRLASFLGPLRQRPLRRRLLSRPRLGCEHAGSHGRDRAAVHLRRRALDPARAGQRAECERARGGLHRLLLRHAHHPRALPGGAHQRARLGLGHWRLCREALHLAGLELGLGAFRGAAARVVASAARCFLGQQRPAVSGGLGIRTLGHLRDSSSLCWIPSQCAQRRALP